MIFPRQARDKTWGKRSKERDRFFSQIEAVSERTQSALMDGLHEARAKVWHRSARKHDKVRVKEMAGNQWVELKANQFNSKPRQRNYLSFEVIANLG